MRRRIAYPAAAVVVALAGSGLGVAAYARAGAPSRAPVAGHAGDVDGDGRADLAVGAPDGTLKDAKGAGYVTLLRGAASGVTGAHHQRIGQASVGVPGVPEAGDHFGTSATLADVNGDGHADLVAGAPGEDIGAKKDAGSVTVVFGGASGLTHRAIAFHAPTATAYDRFGQTLSAADFDHDGRTDVAITSMRRVFVLRGAATLPAAPKLSSFVPPQGESGVTSAAAGDVNHDGYADLTVEYYFDDPADQGTIGVFAGSKSGLATKPSGKTVELGSADYQFAVGDVTGDGRADLVIGSGGADMPPEANLRLYKGTASGYDVANPVDWAGGTIGGGVPRSVGDVDGDGHGDLAVSVDKDDNSGQVTIIRGGASGLVESGVQNYTQNTAGVPGTADNGDLFGDTARLTDLTGDGHADLAAGAPGDNTSSGSVTVLRGTGSGLTTMGATAFTPGTFGYPATGARFGDSLSG